MGILGTARQDNMGGCVSGGDSSSSSKPKRVAKGKEANDQDKAMINIKSQRDKLQMYQERATKLVAREVEIAKEQLKAGNRKRAMLALKKKKYQEQLLTKVSTQLENIEQMISELEFAQVQKEVFDRLKEGTSMLQELNDQMKLEDVEQLMSDTKEAIAYQNEIDEVLSGKLTAEDEEDLLEELSQLEAEKAGESLPDAPEDKVVAPPAAEDSPVVSEEEMEEEEEEREAVLA